MLIHHLFEDTLSDLQASYKRLKSKRNQLRQDSDSIPYPANPHRPKHHRDMEKSMSHMRFVDVDLDDARYERKLRYNIAMRRLISQRITHMNHELAVLGAQIQAEKLKHSPEAIMVNYASYKTKHEKTYLHEIGRMIDQADASLEYPAEDAITGFVGHPYSKSPEYGTAGFMNERPLEDAYSEHPSEKGLQIRQQLDVAFSPIRAALKQMFGNTITIHRAQRPLQGDEKWRNVLSWTSNLKFAEALMYDGFDLLTRDIPIDDIVWITDRANQSEFIVRNYRP